MMMEIMDIMDHCSNIIEDARSVASKVSDVYAAMKNVFNYIMGTSPPVEIERSID